MTEPNAKHLTVSSVNLFVFRACFKDFIFFLILEMSTRYIFNFEEAEC